MRPYSYIITLFDQSLLKQSMLRKSNEKKLSITLLYIVTAEVKGKRISNK